MKKRYFSPLPNAGLWLGLLLTFVALQSGRAQGFFTITEHAKSWHRVFFDTLPNGGHRLNTFQYDLGAGLYYTGTMDLDSYGQVIAWDSVERAGIISQQTYTRMLDGDVLILNLSNFIWSLEMKDINNDGIGNWTYTFPTSPTVGGTWDEPIQNTAHETFVDAITTDTVGGFSKSRSSVYKFSPSGQLLWVFDPVLPDSQSQTHYSGLVPTLDGGCVLVSGTDSLRHLYRLSNTGQLLWEKSTLLYIHSVREGNNGEIYIYSTTGGIIQATAFLEKFDTAGQLLWQSNLNQIFQQTNVVPQYLLAANDGGVLVISWEGDEDQKVFFTRFNANGNLLWRNYYAFFQNGFLNPIGAKSTPDNGFILAGTSAFAPLQNFIFKIGAGGNIYPGAVSGQVALDANVNCLVDTAEIPLANWKVRLATGNGLSLHATTDSSGHYEMLYVPGGNYTLSLLPPVALWESCIGPVSVVIPDTGMLTVAQDFPVSAVADCPFMTLDLATPILRRCFESTYSVHYCNNGTIPATNTYIEITLDPLLQINSASIPYTQIGNILTFPLGDVQPLECSDFTFNVTVDCAAELGQTLCVSAAIFPDSICEPPAGWSGALLEASGHCDGDSVRFQIRNIGSATSSANLDFIVVDDHVIMFIQPLPPLLPNGTHDVSVPADGSTWRLVADQEPNAPGAEMPSVGVEGCGPGAPNWGFFLQFANRDGNPFTDRDCHEVVGAYDPNDKQAFPIGLHDEHFIEANTPLDYQIRFQNTGTDTAFTVIIRDTLSSWLDPASVRPGAASHPYSWTLGGAGILTFTFENILLPDSNVNEAASHGFIQFSLDQRKDNPDGAVIENRAGIYFDFNAPVMTNTVFHTIGSDFLPTATREPQAARLPLLQARPNPAAEVTTIWAEKPFAPGQRLLLRNALGRVVQELKITTPVMQVQLLREGLSAGLYFLEWQDARSGIIGVGKVVFK